MLEADDVDDVDDAPVMSEEQLDDGDDAPVMSEEHVDDEETEGILWIRSVGYHWLTLTLFGNFKLLLNMELKFLHLLGVLGNW